MGKRSDFERRERDFYPTPREAVLPLIPHLPEAFSFWEPCAGAGDLTEHIQAFNIGRVSISTDIEPRAEWVSRHDALTWSPSSINYLSYIITNPPWDRKILHPMIERFSDMRPTWLLFDADWVHTKQAAHYLPRLRKIVAVGRVKWIPDSKHTGKDNCAWHLFTRPSDEPARFYGRVEIRGQE